MGKKLSKKKVKARKDKRNRKFKKMTKKEQYQMKNRKIRFHFTKKCGRAGSNYITPMSQFLKRKTPLRRTSKLGGKILKQIIQIKNFHCLICKRLLLYPILIPCQHVYCLECIQITFNEKKECVECQQPIDFDYFEINHEIQNIINEYIEKNTPSVQSEDYRSRKAYVSQRLQARTISGDITVSTKVDYFDVEHSKWQEGTVAAIQIRRDRKKYIFVEPKDDQTRKIKFKSTSILIVKHLYFTDPLKCSQIKKERQQLKAYLRRLATIRQIALRIKKFQCISSSSSSSSEEMDEENDQNVSLYSFA